MDKLKSMIKGESSSSPSSTSRSTGSNVAREAEHAASGHHSTSGTTGHSSGSSVAREAEQAVSGHHSTHGSSTTAPVTESYETQDQTMAPAVAKETVSRTQHEEVQEIVDRERHQDHYHTTVQPLVDQQVNPTVHKERQAEVQYSEHEHDDSARTKAALEAQQAQFHNTRTDAGTTKTHSNLGTVGSETVHNHMHEIVQPVIEREIVQPSTIHTTVPIKEVHHEAAHIHEATTAAPMSLNEFEGKVQGSHTSGSHTTGTHTSHTSHTN